ncbi:MAG TPA: hypothetical protein VFA35_11840 [Burkholderiaceae bacterium]|nr:hypothetical protein [Burkholderiaceae bacterium]
MPSSDHHRLERLLARLRELERLRVPAHERPILEVARASLLEAISALAHRLHDCDYFHRRPAAGSTGESG